MGYDENFYRLYNDYLQETTVRNSHDLIFRDFGRFTHPTRLDVVDLGCGLGEYRLFGQHAGYVGLDLNATEQIPIFLRRDYHDLSFVKLLPFIPSVFVSLFSIECCHDAFTKYELYNRLFREIPSLQYGLASGFFYESRRSLETVEETGGIASYQTIEDPATFMSPVFTELRTHLRTPSKMFGQDVVEVWKIFARR